MKKKKLILSTTLFLLLLVIMFGENLLQQEEVIYSSKEESEYWKNLQENSVFFEPLDTDFVLGFQSEYCEIQEDELNYEPYSPDKYLTPYLDSIYLVRSSTNYDITQEPKIEKIGKIDKTLILKHEKKGSVEVFIYESFEYEDNEPGIWIGYSENNGKDWSYYYTGIVQRQPVFLKFYSQRPLINKRGKLEIDACLLKQLSPFSHPFPSQSYECVRDGIFVVFDINVIARDSDGDGLTDIVEDKLYLDKYNKDTNGNGIPDNLDMNPRVHYPRTEKSKIYEAILNKDIDSEGIDFIQRLFLEKINATAPIETVLIVTDDEDLMGIQPQKYKVIFMMTAEYKNNANHYKSELNKMYFTPFFKVDNKSNAYIISYGLDTWSGEYLVVKTIAGWRIRMLSSYIS